MSSDGEGGEERIKELRNILDEYLMDNLLQQDMKGPQELMKSFSNKQIMQVCKDIRCLLSIHDDQRFTARSVARVLHGIAGPNYPTQVWGMERRFWRSLDVDLNIVMKLAKTEILSFYHVV